MTAWKNRQRFHRPGDKGYRLEDVYDKKISMETFVAQLSDEDLIMLFRGEGMCSPKVTPGTAAAFAGLTPSLRKFRIPAECASDRYPEYVWTAEQRRFPFRTERCSDVHLTVNWCVNYMK